MTSARLRSLAAGFRKRAQDLTVSHPSASWFFGIASTDYRIAAGYLDGGNIKVARWCAQNARNSTRVARRREKNANKGVQ